MSEDPIRPPDGIEVRQGPYGRGVFARRDFAKGDTIEICPTVEIAEADVSGLLGNYVIASNSDPEKNVLMLGFGSLYNHSYEPSAEYLDIGGEALEFSALREIAAGEEITIDYGEAWWETRDLEPGA